MAERIYDLLWENPMDRILVELLLLAWLFQLGHQETAHQFHH